MEQKVQRFSTKEVKTDIKRTKSEKAVGPDDIPGKQTGFYIVLFHSIHFTQLVHSPKVLPSKIHSYFNGCITWG